MLHQTNLCIVIILAIGGSADRLYSADRREKTLRSFPRCSIQPRPNHPPKLYNPDPTIHQKNPAQTQPPSKSIQPLTKSTQLRPNPPRQPAKVSWR